MLLPKKVLLKNVHLVSRKSIFALYMFTLETVYVCKCFIISVFTVCLADKIIAYFIQSEINYIALFQCEWTAFVCIFRNYKSM